MKFTPQQRELIKATRKKINSLESMKTVFFDDLVCQLNLPERGEDWLFDYICNNHGTIKKIESFLNKKYDI